MIPPNVPRWIVSSLFSLLLSLPSLALSQSLHTSPYFSLPPSPVFPDFTLLFLSPDLTPFFLSLFNPIIPPSVSPPSPCSLLFISDTQSTKWLSLVFGHVTKQYVSQLAGSTSTDFLCVQSDVFTRFLSADMHTLAGLTQCRESLILILAAWLCLGERTWRSLQRVSHMWFI